MSRLNDYRLEIRQNPMRLKVGWGVQGAIPACGSARWGRRFRRSLTFNDRRNRLSYLIALGYHCDSRRLKGGLDPAMNTKLVAWKV